MMKLLLKRLQQLSKTVPPPKYQLGEIVLLNPVEFDTFKPGTQGLILAVNALNDDEQPYITYDVQIEDYPPSEDKITLMASTLKGWLSSLNIRSLRY